MFLFDEDNKVFDFTDSCWGQSSERLENFLRVMYRLASDGLTDQNSKPKSFEHAAIVLCMGDVHVPGFLALIRPLLQFTANRARANGEEQRLIAKYCV